MQVETIGDAYMIVAGDGLLNTSAEHASAVTEFAFSMRDEAQHVLDPNTGQPIEVMRDNRVLVYTRNVNNNIHTRQ